MLEFSFPELSDRKWLSPILSASGKLGSEWAFGTLFIWKNTYYSKICRVDGCTLLCFSGPRHTYNMPLCENESRLPEMIDLMIEDATEKGHPFQLWGATEDQMEKLKRFFPGRFLFSLDRDGSDYLYKSEDLIRLAGRKFHGKRNHISQFERKYDWSYEDLCQENLEDCRLIAKQWCKTHGCRDQDGFASEPCAIDRALDHFEGLHLAGGLIRVSGEPVAFTIGEEINPKAYLLHFEKALDGYDGLYAVINHEYAARHLEQYELINREEDMGIEGLRKAKLSYHPALLLNRYRVTLAEKNGDAET